MLAPDFGPMVTALITSTKLFHVEPGQYWDGWPCAGILSRYVINHSGELSFLLSAGREMSAGQLRGNGSVLRLGR